MISDIENAEKPIATIVKGKAMSCGAVLMTCGTEGYRFIDPHARVMIHEVSSGQASKVSDFEVSASEMRRMNDQIFQIMAKNCSKEADYFINQMAERKNVDWYLTPAEAIKIGMANHLKVPTLTREVNINYRFG
jgi:ATP-dependent Clp protease protease subunit